MKSKYAGNKDVSVEFKVFATLLRTNRGAPREVVINKFNSFMDYLKVRGA